MSIGSRKYKARHAPQTLCIVGAGIACGARGSESIKRPQAKIFALTAAKKSQLSRVARPPPGVCSEQTPVVAQRAVEALQQVGQARICHVMAVRAAVAAAICIAHDGQLG